MAGAPWPFLMAARLQPSVPIADPSSGAEMLGWTCQAPRTCSTWWISPNADPASCRTCSSLYLQGLSGLERFPLHPTCHLPLAMSFYSCGQSCPGQSLQVGPRPDCCACGDHSLPFKPLLTSPTTQEDLRSALTLGDTGLTWSTLLPNLNSCLSFHDPQNGLDGSYVL